MLRSRQTALHLVFVYGTLKKGYYNNYFLENQTFIKEAISEPKYLLYDNGSYPCLLIADKDGFAVKGEIWEVDDPCLHRLDMLEGTAGPRPLYKRGTVDIQDDSIKSAIGYFYQRNVDRFTPVLPKNEEKYIIWEG